MPSVTQALSDAFAWMRYILFQPFDAGKWFVLGFCAFLAGLGGGGGPGGRPGGGGSGRGGGGGPDTAEIVSFVEGHLFTILFFAALGVLFVTGLVALITWLSSRGKFMFLHGVATNRPAVVEPWKRFKRPANSLFAFRFLLFLAAGVLFLGLAALAAFVAWPDLEANRFGGRAAGALALFLGPLLLGGLGLALLANVLEDFVVPVMYLRDVRALEGLRIFVRELLPGHVGTFALFYLLKIALALGASIVVVLGICLTCCLAALPYLSSVFFLPVTVFFRCYSLCLLEQLGPPWQVFLPGREPRPEPTGDRYDDPGRENPGPVYPPREV